MAHKEKKSEWSGKEMSEECKQHEKLIKSGKHKEENDELCKKCKIK